MSEIVAPAVQTAARVTPAPVAIRVTVNGIVRESLVAPHRSLLEWLREDLGLTGAKRGCDAGDCGACTVLLDGAALPSCLTLAVEADGRVVTTIEGIASDGALHPVQEAFLEHAAVQCGFCTPGMILSSVALLREDSDPTDHEIRFAIAGNLCRCTGYTQIVDAVRVAAGRLRAERAAETEPVSAGKGAGDQ